MNTMPSAVPQASLPNGPTLTDFDVISVPSSELFGSILETLAADSTAEASLPPVRSLPQTGKILPLPITFVAQAEDDAGCRPSAAEPAPERTIDEADERATPAAVPAAVFAAMTPPVDLPHPATLPVAPGQPEATPAQANGPLASMATAATRRDQHAKQAIAEETAPGAQAVARPCLPDYSRITAESHVAVVTVPLAGPEPAVALTHGGPTGHFPAVDPRHGLEGFAAIVDRIIAARTSADTGGPVTFAVRNPDFGAITLRFEPAASGLSVAIAGTDPDLAKAVAASAATERPAWQQDAAARDQQYSGASGDGRSATQSQDEAGRGAARQRGAAPKSASGDPKDPVSVPCDADIFA